ncbi:class I adenylate-forming enzyme family protein [Roseovarius atlanticus]|uniref:class I adenylate-forming enzyme family protein n=1 Tax=Roseovarius atlanticus TaxID=1641875 RepID=UPI001C96FFA5|nr:class I adenylate-forming enzyme family protein [Roseovarius atlanticus]MBY5987520.1 acyl--CoA ligase [Roseovarius atlanticus]MBY6122911.1 acyl--CoA ligase [Roseovarius atlanticus]MBY6147407.1 acyl--CoA ligase [Roseovarius atlanticus]
MSDFVTAFEQQARLRGDAPALFADGQTIGYATLHARVVDRAAAMLTSGLVPGDRIALLQDRSVDLCTDLLAGLHARLPLTVLSRSEAQGSVVAKLVDGGFTGLICDDTNREAAQALADAAGLRLVTPLVPEDTANRHTMPVPRAEEEALLIFTSGSSGRPKAVRLSHGNIAANTRGLSEITPVGGDDHYLHMMPLSHTNGILNQLLYPLMRGARITLLPRFTPEAALEAMADLKPTVVTGVPTMFQRLLDHPIPQGATDRLRMLRCGSAPLAVETQDRIEAHLGCQVLVSYGQTEFTCTSTANPPGAARRGSVGRAIPGAEVAILEPGEDTPLPIGSRGEVAFRGPLSALGYVGHPPFDPEGWVRSGDLGYLDADGYLFLTGRLKEIIIRGGENLAPASIEDVLLASPGIRAACVVPAPHADLGEVPFAFVEGTSQIEALDDLNRKIRDALGRAHCLAGIERVDRLPENHVGKIDRKRLTADLSQRMSPALTGG